MKELELKYGCNPNQKPARIFMAEGELPAEVLNGRPGVKPATKEKILQITKALHYEPNILGKALVSTEPIKIGIILTPAYNPCLLYTSRCV